MRWRTLWNAGNCRDRTIRHSEPFLGGHMMAIEHLWWVLTTFSQRPDLPAFDVESAFIESVPDVGCQQDRMPKTLLASPDCTNTVSERRLNLFVVTYNVGSLGARRTTVRIGYLREQMEAHSISLACLQETRARNSQLVTSGTHIRITSAAVSGKEGVEIWLGRQDSAGSTLFHPKKVLVLHADSEILLVKAVVRGVTLLVCSAH